MTHRLGPWALLLTLGCTASSSVGEDAMVPVMDSSALDAGPIDPPPPGIDAGADDAGPPLALCEPHDIWGCSSAVDRWVWNGSECEMIVECPMLGDATRRECQQSHVMCGAIPFECDPIACPLHCDVACDDEPSGSYCDCGDEGSFVLISQERACTADGAPEWRFTLAPRAETTSLGRDIGALREDLAEASETIEIRLSGNRDPFHDPEQVDVAAMGLHVERCLTYESPCEVPAAGFIEVETGGAGEMRIDIQLSFTGGDVRVSPGWFSVNYVDNSC